MVYLNSVLALAIVQQCKMLGKAQQCNETGGASAE